MNERTRAPLPKIDYADLRWMQAFESVKKNGVNSGFKIIHVSDDPAWIHVKSKAGNRMVRKVYRVTDSILIGGIACS